MEEQVKEVAKELKKIRQELQFMNQLNTYTQEPLPEMPSEVGKPTPKERAKIAQDMANE